MTNRGTAFLLTARMLELAVRSARSDSRADLEAPPRATVDEQGDYGPG